MPSAKSEHRATDQPVGRTGSTWQVETHEPSGDALANTLGLPPIIGQLLSQRDIHTAEAAREFLAPRLRNLSDPFDLTDLEAAAHRLLDALDQQQRIVIYGDYDVDGITSSALLWRVLTSIGGDVRTFLPMRMSEGYGLSLDALERCVEEHQPDLLLAVDCGTTSVAEVAWLRERGIDVLIADHHELPPELPEAAALVNPHRDNRHTYLASVGLAFKLCHGLLKARPTLRDKIDLRSYLDLVATGTVADLVPLIDDNRIFVNAGLGQIPETKWIGLSELCRVSDLGKKPLTTTDIGFRLGPRINASGRLGDAARSLALLKSDAPEEARELAEELDRNNRERQALERRTTEEAENQLADSFNPDTDFGIVLADEGWHPGVIGIVASRIQRTYHRPTFIIGIDEQGIGKGSGRSIDGFSIIAALRASAHTLLQFGGHEMAAGLSIEAARVADFRKSFNQFAAENLEPAALQPRLKLAGQITAHDISVELFEDLKLLAPYGRHNPEPVFAIHDVRLVGQPNTFGRGHLKFDIEGAHEAIEVIAWRMADHPQPPRSGDILAGILQWSDYHDTVQIELKDWRSA